MYAGIVNVHRPLFILSYEDDYFPAYFRDIDMVQYSGHVLVPR
jgi:hypothetical protein